MSGQDAFTMNCYDILGVDSKATHEQLKEARTRIANQLHPDKQARARKLEGKHQTGDANQNGAFSNVTEAYNILRNPVRRALHDIKWGLVPDTEQERRRIRAMQRESVEQNLPNIEETARANRERELSCSGLIIVEAKYGCQEGDASPGTYCDVAAVLQSKVADSQLVLQSGMPLSWNDFFCEPCASASTGAGPGSFSGASGGKVEHELYVLYRFGGLLHEAVVGDTEGLCLPQQAHQMREADQFRRQPRPRVASSHEERQVKRKRRIVLYAGLALLLAAGLLRTRRSLWSWFARPPSAARATPLRR